MRWRRTGTANVADGEIPRQAGPPGPGAVQGEADSPGAPAGGQYGERAAAPAARRPTGQATGDAARAEGAGVRAAPGRRYKEPAPPGYGRPAGFLTIVRSKGALAGLLLVLLGIWGAIVPFIGPYFSYGLGSSGPWQYTTGRLWLHILPGAAVLLAGAVLAASRNRATGWIAAWIAVAGGLWFVVGSQISRLWAGGTSAEGPVTGAVGHQVAQAMGYYAGLGAVIIIVAAFAAGRLAVVGVRDVRAAGNQRDRSKPWPGAEQRGGNYGGGSAR